MRSAREEERLARAYCTKYGLEPDEVVKGYFNNGKAVEWTEAPRWCWYRGANEDQDRPLTGFEKAMAAQRANRDAALARSTQRPPAQAPAFVQIHTVVVPGVVVVHGIPKAVYDELQARQAG